MSANDFQYGGDHYRRGGDYQHWDFVADLELSYFQGCASKYVSRSRFKGQFNEDLKKAVHYCQKAKELDDTEDLRASGGVWLTENDRISSLWRFAVANDLTLHEGEALWYICSQDWSNAERKINYLMEQTP